VTTPSPSDRLDAPFEREHVGRAVILVLVVVAVALSLVVPVREYLDQRSRMQALVTQTEQSRAAIAAFSEQKERWQDTAYVMAQARTRLHMVMPGETAFIVVGDPPAPKRAATAPVPAEPWYSQAWARVTEVFRR